MKLKHNKKRNTAFLFEVLVRELTLASIKANQNRKKTIVKVLKEFFHKNTLWCFIFIVEEIDISILIVTFLVSKHLIYIGLY